jgi:hypothetical protein
MILIAACGEGRQGSDGGGFGDRAVAIPIGGGETLALPATFSGELPCERCAQRRITLTLRPDTIFFARTTQPGDEHAPSRHELGRWSIDSALRKLTLRSGMAAETEFRIVDGTTLRAEAASGSASGLTLTRSDRVDRFDETLHLRGIFIHGGESALLSECATGKSWPIVHDSELRSLERAYLTLREAPGVAMLVSVHGRFVVRRGDAGLREMVRIERIGRLSPSTACDAAAPRPHAASTPWRLASLIESVIRPARGDAVPAAP